MAAHSALNPNAKILIAEDVKSARLALRKLLETLGYHNIVETADGQEAWAKLMEHSDVQLVVSDWQMPELDGLELANRMQEHEQFKNIPFIMATAKGELEDLALATVVGVWGYVVKPVTAQGLADEIRGVFEEEQPAPVE